MKTKMKTGILVGWALALVCAVGAQVVLDTGAQTQAFGPGKGRGYTVALRPEWGVLTLRTRMKTTDLVRGREGWMNGRIPMSFHDKTGKRVGPWPNVFGFEGTCGWTDCVRDFPIPEGAATLRIGPHNFGTSGTVEVGPLTLAVKRNRVARPCNAPLPAGAPPDPGSLDDAWRATTPTRARWSLNGLWQLRPVLTNDVPDAVPGADDNWGWGKIPGMLGAGWATGQEVVLSDWFEDHGVKPDFSEAAWYGRTFTMPRETAGRRVVVTFTTLNTRAAVYVDGQAAATVVFPGGEADITPFVKPGTRQTLALHVTAYPLDPKTLEFSAPDRAVERKNTVKFRGVTGDVYLDAFPKTARIADGTVACDVAGGRATFVAECEGVATNALYTLVARVGARTFEGARLRPDADGRLAFTADWADAPKWDVHTPGNLLTCALELRDAAGTPLDAALPFRFGFRDIRAIGRDLRLNGTTIHLRALYNRNINGSTALAAKETCRALCRRLKAEGFNYIIAGNYDFAPGTVSYMDGLLEACDEEGMLFSFSLPHIRDFGVQLDRPEVAARYRARARWCIRRARNHPSVVTYAMNHNATGYCGDMNPLRIDGRYELKEDAAHRFRNRSQAKIAAAIARSLDATRPIYHHESGNLDDFHTVNIYLNWSPVQERSDWLEHWSAQGVKPLFFVEWGMPHISSWSSYRGPLFIWRKAGYQSLWASEFAAAFRGDAAYEGATPEAVRALAREEALWAQGKPMFWGHLNAPIRGLTNNYHGVQALYMDDNWRSHRAWGISAMLPWDQGAFHTRVRPASARPNPARWEKLKAPGVVPDWFPDGEWDVGTGAEADFARTKVGDVLYRWNREDCAFIGGAGVFTDKRHHYRPGEELRKTLVILNDRRVEQEVAWTWTLAETTRAGTARVPAGGRVDVPLACTLPQKAGAWELKAAFTFAGGAVQRDAFALETYAPAKTARVENLLLCDPVGLTAKAFDRLGIAYGRTDGRTALPDAARLVVGRGALTRTLFNDVVVPAARRRGRVLIFEQDKETLESIGFRAQNYGLRNAFARYPEPRLALTGAKLRDWNGAATLIPTHLQNLAEIETGYPRERWAGFDNTRVWRCGNRGSLASVLPEKPSVGDWRALVDGAFDLQYAPLLDWMVERGRITFCQLDVTARTVADPVADDLVHALVARLADPVTWPKWPRALGQRAWLAGLAYQIPIKQDPDDRESGAYLVSSGAVKPADFDAQIAKGGRALLLGLTAEEIAQWSPVKLAAAPTNGCYASRIEKLPPELNGLSNGDWAWHGALAFTAFTEPAADGNEALRVVRHGKGVLVFWQTPPWTIDADAKPYLRTTKRRANAMLARLMGNLGFVSTALSVRYGDVPVPEDDPYRYYRW